MMQQAKHHTDALTDAASRALLACRNELYSLFPYLDAAFAALPLQPSADTAALGTDGVHLIFSPRFAAETFVKTPAALRRGYLHMLLHCLFLHPFRAERTEDPWWPLACDMAVEQLIERENRPRLSLPANEVKEGEATLLCTLGDDGVCAYRVEISHIEHGNRPTKSFTVRVTDPKLLERTGGIVQGMSGSPLIQEGRLVGAVTHVLVDDPTAGYGIFLENMLAASQLKTAA